MRVILTLVVTLIISRVSAVVLPNDEITGDTISDSFWGEELQRLARSNWGYSGSNKDNPGAEMRENFVNDLKDVVIKMNSFVTERNFDNIGFAPYITEINQSFETFDQTIRDERKGMFRIWYFPNMLRRLFEDQLKSMVNCVQLKEHYQNTGFLGDRLIAEMAELQVLAYSYRSTFLTLFYDKREYAAKILRLYCKFLTAVENYNILTESIIPDDPLFWRNMALAQKVIEKLRFKIRDKNAWGKCFI